MRDHFLRLFSFKITFKRKFSDQFFAPLDKVFSVCIKLKTAPNHKLSQIKNLNEMQKKRAKTRQFERLTRKHIIIEKL